MKVVGSIAHPVCKITLFDWNQKYLVKFELGSCEQTFKFSHFDVAGLAELRGSITTEFIDRALARFHSMHEDLEFVTST